jgi:hypothetical protein
MNTAGLVVIIATIIVLIVAAVVLLRQGHPESSSTHLDELPPDSTTERVHGYSERPAGADAEEMGSPDTSPPR